MSFQYTLKISAAGMAAQRQRLNVIASNLANVTTTRTPEGGPYQRKDIVFRAAPLLEQDTASLRNADQPELLSVETVQVISDPRPPILKYQPEHPDADEGGYVAFPNVNAMEEMVNMLSASRSYEANLTMMKTAKDMTTKTIDILKV
ncbi:MAG: flagellar basal body rod protein FlgC [Deltaproteobacteria bacterium]|nr:flagellar basal body rod protein FlgC [Candidatus Anaeroferrophillus wilburensis]MBN2888481.1 flagellar basal body rod protein FlgC [Deltaproteobacteria bacterium]